MSSQHFGTLGAPKHWKASIFSIFGTPLCSATPRPDPALRLKRDKRVGQWGGGYHIHIYGTPPPEAHALASQEFFYIPLGCQVVTLRKYWKKLAPPTFSATEAQKKLVGPTFSKISTIFLETSWKSRNWWKKLAPPTFSAAEVRKKLVGPTFSKNFHHFPGSLLEIKELVEKVGPTNFFRH